MENFPAEIITNQINFEAYGVKLGIRSANNSLVRRTVNRLEEIIPTGFRFIDLNSSERIFEIKEETDGRISVSEGENVLALAGGLDDFDNLIESRIRLHIAEFAKNKVFLHAGVVAWNKMAIIIPGSSFAGKTTLVSELIKKGAEYYSDEYAVLDKDGFVHPFPKRLSVRGIIDDYKQLDLPADSFGAKNGSVPVPVGLVLISKFEREIKRQDEFTPELLTNGAGLMEILLHSISIRHNPKFVLKVLNKITTRAIIAKSQRGEAKIFANRLIDYLDKQVCFKPK